MNNFMNNPGLQPLLPSLNPLFGDYYYRKERLDDNQLSVPIIQTTANYVFVVLKGYVWKSKSEKKIIFSNFDEFLSDKNSDIESGLNSGKNDDNEKMSDIESDLDSGKNNDNEKISDIESGLDSGKNDDNESLNHCLDSDN